MSAFIEVVSVDVVKREGRNEGGHWMSRTQEAFMHQGGAYPTPFTIRLDENQMPFQPGKYVLGFGSYRLGKYGLELSRELNLVPLDQAVKQYQQVTSARPAPAAA